MNFKETKLAGAFIIELEQFADERGFFARTWSQKEFAERGLESRLVECNASLNPKKGTLRGMHYQAAPYAQAKVVSCSKGAVYDVIIDLRPASPTFKQWVGIELTENNHLMLYIPQGFAHGFQTLADNSEVAYQMFAVYVPESGRGVRWDDPVFRIQWPEDERIIAERDLRFPDFEG